MFYFLINFFDSHMSFCDQNGTEGLIWLGTIVAGEDPQRLDPCMFWTCDAVKLLMHMSKQ